MVISLADYIITEDESYINTYDTISKEMDKKAAPDFIDPSSPESEDTKIDRSFESINIALSENIGMSADEMTIVQFYSAIKHIEDKNKAMEQAMKK